jgi:hypothetical protein
MDKDAIKITTIIETILHRYVEPELAQKVVDEAFDKLEPVIQGMVRQEVSRQLDMYLAQIVKGGIKVTWEGIGE